MVGAQRPKEALSPRRKLQELAAQRVRYPHIPAASQHRVSLQYGRCTRNGYLHRDGMDKWYHAGTLERQQD